MVWTVLTVVSAIVVRGVVCRVFSGGDAMRKNLTLLLYCAFVEVVVVHVGGPAGLCVSDRVLRHRVCPDRQSSGHGGDALGAQRSATLAAVAPLISGNVGRQCGGAHGRGVRGVAGARDCRRHDAGDAVLQRHADGGVEGGGGWRAPVQYSGVLVPCRDQPGPAHGCGVSGVESPVRCVFLQRLPAVPACAEPFNL